MSERRKWRSDSNVDFLPNYVVKNKSPAPANEDTKLYTNSILSALEANDNLRSLVSRLIEREQDKHFIDSEIAELKLQIMQAMGEHDALTFDNKPLITWKSHVRHDFDTQRFKEDRPELYEKYLKQTERRPFKLC